MNSQRRGSNEGKKTMSRGTEAARSKRNATRACQPCRRRKSKCDGATPCSTCALYHDECVYSAEQDGRKPPAKSYVLALEERVKMLENMLKNVGSTSDLLGPEQTSMAPDNDGDVPEIGLESLKIDEETHELLHYGPTSAFQHLPEPSHSTSPGVDDARGMSQSPGASQSAPTGSFFSRATGGIFSHRSSTAPGNFDWRGPIEWARDLPPSVAQHWDARLHGDLLDRFFRYFNVWCLWVDENAFRHDMALCLGESSHVRTSAYSPLLHNAVLSLACSLSDDERLLDQSNAKQLALKAKSLIEDEGERPMLSTLQGLLLLGSYHSGNGLQGLGYLYSGIAFRMCPMLGLAIESEAYVQRGILTPEIKRARDRIMWCAYVQDKLWSSYVGRNPSLLRSSIEISIPAADATIDKQSWSPISCDLAAEQTCKPVQGFTSSSFHWTCRLGVIEEKILTTVYGLRVNLYASTVQNKVSELHLELESWASSLPVELRIAPQTLRPPPPHIIMLNCMYQFCVILLHRPYYVRHTAAKNLHINDVAIKRCDTAATRIVLLFELYQRSPGLRYAPISATQIAFAAATTHLLALVNASAAQQKRKAEDALQATKSCGRILREMGRAYKCALQTADIFDGLVEKWHPKERTPTSEPSGGPSDMSASAGPWQAAAVQALDPQSSLAKELLRLGWTPPVAPPGQDRLLAPASRPMPLLDNPRTELPTEQGLLYDPSQPAMGSLEPVATDSAVHAAALPTNDSFDRFGTWPLFASAAPSPTSLPFAQQQPIPDDIFGGLLSSEVHGASEAFLRSRDGIDATGVHEGYSGPFTAFGPMSGTGGAPAWYGFGPSG